MKNLSILKEIEQFARQYNLPIIGSRKGEVLINVIKKYKPKRILEIGTLIGYSTILMASYLKDGKITTIEIDNKVAEIAKENFKKAKFFNINLITGNALNIIPKLKEKFDMLFLDAAKEEYYSYLKYAEPKLNKNAVIVDDIISTGNTILETAKILRRLGAKKIYCICVHGIFVNDAFKKLKKAGINVVSTNTIPNKAAKIDVSGVIGEDLLKQS